MTGAIPHSMTKVQKFMVSSLHNIVDCQEYFENGYTTDGIYTLQITEKVNIEAWCQFEGDKGWTVVLRRETGLVNFDQDWREYKYGFGDLNSEYWIGNLSTKIIYSCCILKLHTC